MQFSFHQKFENLYKTKHLLSGRSFSYSYVEYVLWFVFSIFLKTWSILIFRKCFLVSAIHKGLCNPHMRTLCFALYSDLPMFSFVILIPEFVLMKKTDLDERFCGGCRDTTISLDGPGFMYTKRRLTSSFWVNSCSARLANKHQINKFTIIQKSVFVKFWV